MNNYSDENTSDQTDLRPTNYSRRKWLKCMSGWAGTGVVWTIGAGGLLTACGELTNTPSPTTAIPNSPSAAPTTPSNTAPVGVTPATTGPTRAANVPGFTFVQVSDTHIGFNTDGVNTDVNATLQQTISRINALAQPPAFVLHTGDVSHMSKPGEFDTAFQLMNTIKTSNIFYVPGEHDVINDQGAGFRQRFLARGPAKSWYSMDFQGIHFIGLSNAGELDAFGILGAEQLAWLQKDLSGVKKDTPVVVFAHVPLFTVYKPWSWETKDSAQALALLKPYSAVTVLKGHIHQVVTQVEGTINFYTANSTAFPQHRPGVDKPNAYKLPASELLQNLGYRTINLVPGNSMAAISDYTLAGTPASSLAITPGSEAAPPVTVTTGISSTAGYVDVGAEADFANATSTPQKITLPAPNGKTGSQMAFVLKQGNQYLGLSDICTHMGCEVSWVGQDSRFECPCHGSQYDITGKNVAGPAPRPLPRFKTQLSNGRLLIAYQPEEAGN